MDKPCLIIGDIGGTNARFALAHPYKRGFYDEKTLSCADYGSAADAINYYLQHVCKNLPDVICLAVAGPVIDQSVSLTNNHWRIDGSWLKQNYSSSSVQLLNDFEAIAYSVPMLAAEELMSVGALGPAIEKKKEYTLGIIGPGTGLGMGGLQKRAGNIYPIVGEGSHSGFAPETDIQFEVLKQLGERFERVSEERLLSGPGLVNIYGAICRVHGENPGEITATEIFSRALSRQDVPAVETLKLFYEALGQVAGNLALTLGAFDGVYLAGGILKRYPDLLKASGFRSGFENKGRYRSLMEGVPTILILHPQPGLLGASHRARELHRQRII